MGYASQLAIACLVAVACATAVLVPLSYGLAQIALLVGRDGPAPPAYHAIPAVFRPSVRETLRQAWSVYDLPTPQPEYAFCVFRYQVIPLADSTPMLQIDSIVPANIISASPMSVEYNCGVFPAIHSHPPTDCTVVAAGGWSCAPAEQDDTLCEPSQEDVLSTVADWHRFHGIQCGADRLFFFTPSMEAAGG